MNERIRELAKQAGGNPNYKAFRGYFLPPPPDYIDPATVDLGKFAEFIVKECIGCCEQVISDPVPKSVDTWLNGGSQCIDQIKQHFGVEE